jgi:hypothetical protein
VKPGGEQNRVGREWWREGWVEGGTGGELISERGAVEGGRGGEWIGGGKEWWRGGIGGECIGWTETLVKGDTSGGREW